MSFSAYAYDEEITLIEVGDEEMFIGFFALDEQAFDNTKLGVNEQTSGSGAISDSKYKLPQEVNLDVLDDRYESGDNIFSTLELEIPQTVLSQGGVFEYSIVGPNGIEYEMKSIIVDNNKNKLITYNLPETAEDGVWTMKGQIKFEGYEPVKVSDTFKVKNYSIFIWYLLAIIVISIMGIMIYSKRKSNNIEYE